MNGLLQTMLETDKDMNAKYRETTQVCLAVKVIS